MKRRRTLTIIVGALAVGLGIGQASGYPVTWHFAGEITTVADPTGVLGGAVTVGSPFNGSFTFESTTPDSLPNDNTHGSYDNAFTSVSGQVGSLSFLGPVGSLNFISILNDHSICDCDGFGAQVQVELLGEQPVLRFTTIDSTATIFSDDSLPLLPLDLGYLDPARVDMFLESDSVPFAFGADLTVFVPEPTTLVVLVSGVVIVAIRRRIRR